MAVEWFFFFVHGFKNIENMLRQKMAGGIGSTGIVMVKHCKVVIPANIYSSDM
jgi:hypothetical protein